MTKVEDQDLKGKILFFSPNEAGTSYFTDSLIFICINSQLFTHVKIYIVLSYRFHVYVDKKME